MKLRPLKTPRPSFQYISAHSINIFMIREQQQGEGNTATLVFSHAAPPGERGPRTLTGEGLFSVFCYFGPRQLGSVRGAFHQCFLNKESAYCGFVSPLSAAHRSRNKRDKETKLSSCSSAGQARIVKQFSFFKSIQYER